MHSKNKAQGSLEYLLLIGGSVLIAAIVIISVTYLFSSENSNTSKTVYQSSYSCLAAQTDSSLIGYWQFEGNLNDCSLYGHDGTASTTSAFEEGVIGKAISLDNATADYVDFGNINLTGDQLTVEFWVNAIDNSGLGEGDNFAPILIDWMNGSSNGTLLCYIKSNPGWSAGNNFDTNSILCTYDSGSSLNDLGTVFTDWYDEWHHVAFVLDGTDFSVYVDGVLDNSKSTFINPISPDNEIFALSKRDWTYGVPFHGYIDELRIYDRALDQPEIQEHALN